MSAEWYHGPPFGPSKKPSFREWLHHFNMQLCAAIGLLPNKTVITPAQVAEARKKRGRHWPLEFEPDPELLDLHERIAQFDRLTWQGYKLDLLKFQYRGKTVEETFAELRARDT